MVGSKGMARPRIPEGEKRVPVKVYLRPASIDLFRAHAEARGQELSEWAAETLGKAYERESRKRPAVAALPEQAEHGGRAVP
jgi:hypothetical protein